MPNFVPDDRDEEDYARPMSGDGDGCKWRVSKGAGTMSDVIDGVSFSEASLKRMAMANAAVDGATHSLTKDTRRRLALSALIAKCQVLVASSNLPEHEELELRYLTSAVLATFDMPSRRYFTEDWMLMEPEIEK